MKIRPTAPEPGFPSESVALNQKGHDTLLEMARKQHIRFKQAFTASMLCVCVSVQSEQKGVAEI